MTDQTPAQRNERDATDQAPETDETLERLTAQYTDEYRAGQSPRPDEYIKRFPQYARELAEFFLYFHTITVDLPDPDPFPTSSRLPPAAAAALARFRERYATQPTQPSAQPEQPVQMALTGLAKRGKEVGLTPTALEQQVGVSSDLMLRLEARAIKAAEIPRELIRRLTVALQVAPAAIVNFFGGSSAGAGQPASAFFYADQPPQTQQQDGFLDAVRASRMTQAQKDEWERIVRAEQAEQSAGASDEGTNA